MGISLNQINRRFKVLGEYTLKHRLAILLVVAFLCGVACWGLPGLEFSASNDLWFFDNDPVIVLEKKFEKIFGNAEMCAVHIQVDDVFTKENLTKIRELTEELDDKTPLEDDVVSLTDFEYLTGTDEGMEVGDLIPEQIPSAKAQLAELKRKALTQKSLLNRLISDDAHETWVLVELKEKPDDWEHNRSYLAYLQNKARQYPELFKEIDLRVPVDPDELVGKIINKIAGQPKYQSLNPRTTGALCATAEKREFFSKETPRLVGLGLLISIIILAFFTRSFFGVVFPMLTAFGSILITLGIEGHLKTMVDSSMLMVPFFLSLAVAVGYAIHIYNFFKQEFLQTGNRKGAVIYAVENTGWPLLFTALTTMGALMSFLFIKIKVLNWVGYTSALMVGLAYLLVILIFPILLSWGKDRKPDNVGRKGQNVHFKNGLISEAKLALFGKWVLANATPIIVIFAVFTIAAIYGLTKMKVDLGNESTMGRKIPYVDKLLRVGETKIGSVQNYDIGIEFSRDNLAKDPQILKKLDRFVTEIQSFKLTKRTTCILDKLKEVNQILNEGRPEFYRVPQNRESIAQMLLLYENAGGTELDKWVDYNYRKLRVRVEISKYVQSELLAEYERIKASGAKLFPEAKVVLSGSIAKYADMSYKVSVGQMYSFGLSLVIIGVMMMLVFGSVKIGLIALIPNIIPALAVGGVMGWFNISLDMITATIMPMILGLAVDDTIHFINHVEYEYQKNNDYDLAIANTFRLVGKSLIMTSVILVLNFSAYLTSVAKIYIHIGILTGVGIITALLADYFLTPLCLNLSKPFRKYQYTSPQINATDGKR